MGQYFRAVSLDVKEAVRPFGAKMMEHSWVGNTFLSKVERLLSPGNKWHKTRIVWAGDYMKAGIFMDQKPRYPDLTLYGLSHEWADAGDPGDGPEPRYLINHTKNLYVNLKDIPVAKDYSLKNIIGLKVHPLPILTATSIGEGGGDYGDIDDENIETWAGDVLSTDYKRPRGMKKYKDLFVHPYGRPQTEETK